MMAAMVDLGSWVGGLASKVWEPQKGLPFGSYLHSTQPRRQRTLTGPLDATQQSLWHKLQVLSAVEHEQQTHSQEQCGFLSVLPLDVRLMIYDLVLGGMVLHIGTERDSRSRILTHICQHPERGFEGNHQACLAPSIQRPSSAPRDDYPQATGLLPLLVTCRRIYSEAIATLYSANTFEFWENRAAWNFLKVMVPPQRLRSIRRFRWAIQIPHHPDINYRSRRDWSDLWTFFANETCSLQHLYLSFNRNHPFERIVEQTRDDEAAGFVEPIVLMAVDANRNRGCRVEVVTGGIVHSPDAIYKDIARVNYNTPHVRLLELTCAEMHHRIRLSFNGHG